MVLTRFSLVAFLIAIANLALAQKENSKPLPSQPLSKHELELSGFVELKNFVFLKGFAVEGAQYKTEVETLTKNTLIACPGICEIQSGEHHLAFDFDGFGKLELTYLLARDIQARYKPKAFIDGGAPPVMSEKSKEEVETQNPDAELSPEEVPLRIPYPADRTLILLRKSAQILILPKERCESGCELEVRFQNKVIFQKSFQAGRQPVYRFVSTKKFYGEWSWTFTDTEDPIEHSFEIQSFSQKRLTDAIMQERPTEIP